MGKDKNARRLKDHQKPSSSIRSAELLGGLSNQSSFLGFGAVGGFAPAAQGTQYNDNSITPDFRLAIRKMAKKDAVTKIKALQEFNELITSEDLSSIKTVLPFWPRLFSKLSMDIDNKVREGCQTCNGHLAQQVGKPLAPHLRSLAPYWLLGMSDTSTNVACAATQAFELVFSEEKRPGVVFHASKEIIDMLSDNLFKQTPETLSDPNCSSFDRLEKYQRVICSSLSCLSLVQRLCQQHDDYTDLMLPPLTVLLHQQPFWDFNKHTNDKIRAAFFSCLSGIVGCEGCDISNACEAVRRGLMEQQPAVLVHVITALLHLVQLHPSCWSVMLSDQKSNKSVASRVLRLVVERCRGAATEVAPLLLPLLSQMPYTALEQPHVYYTDILQALANCVLECSSVKSRQDVAVLQQSFFECVKLLSKRRALTVDFWQHVVKNMVGPVLGLALMGHRQLDSGATFEQTVALANCWAARADITRESPSNDTQSDTVIAALQNLKTSNDEPDPDLRIADNLTQTEITANSTFSCKLLNMLWIECFNQCNVILDQFDTIRLERFRDFLNTIKFPKYHSHSKKSGVKFAVGNDKKSEGHSSPCVSSNTAPLTSTTIVQQFTGSRASISELVCHCHSLYTQNRENQHQRLQYMRVLCTLLDVFSQLAMYGALLEGDQEQEQDMKCMQFLERVLVPELGIQDYELSRVVVNCWQVHLLTLGQRQQTAVLDQSMTACSVASLRAVLESGTLLPAEDSAAVQCWLCSAVLGARLVSIVQEALGLTAVLAYELTDDVDQEQDAGVAAAAQQREQLVQLVQLVLSARVVKHGQMEFQFSSNYISQMLIVLYTCLPTQLLASHYDDNATSCINSVQLVLQLTRTVFRSSTCWQLPHSCTLLQSLFLLITPRDVLTSQDDDEADDDDDVLTDSVLPKHVATFAHKIFSEAFKSFVAVMSTDEGEAIRAQYTQCVCRLFQHVKDTLNSPGCSFSTTRYLSRLTTECLMAISRAASMDEDWEVPLDQQGVRAALELVLPSEGVWAVLEATMSSEYVTPSVMLAPWAILPSNSQDKSVYHDYSRWAVFVSGLLLELCGPLLACPATDALQEDVEALLRRLQGHHSSASRTTQQEQNEQISLGPYSRLACVCVHASCYLITVSRLHGALNTGRPSLVAVSKELAANTRALVQQLNRGQVQQLVQLCRDAACHSSLWCPTLQLLLTSWVDPAHLNIAKLLHGIDASASNATPVTQILLAFLSPEEVASLLTSEATVLASLIADPLLGVGPLGVVCSALQRVPEAGAAVGATMDVLLAWWKDADSLFLFAADVSEGNRGEDMLLVVSVVRVVTVIIEHHSHHLTPTHWERLLCATTSWVQSLQQADKSVVEDVVLGTLVCAVSRCVAALERLMARLPTLQGQARSRYPDQLSQEWQEFYSGFLHSALLPLFFQISCWYSDPGGRSVALYCVSRSLSEYAIEVPVSDVTQVSLPPLLHEQDDGHTHSLPSELQVLVNHCCAGLLCPQPSIAAASYRVLYQLLPTVMDKWCSSAPQLVQEEDQSQHPQNQLPHVLTRLILQCGGVVSEALDERCLLAGECFVLPYTDSHTYTLAYCLVWHLTLAALQLCPSETRQLYALQLRNKEFVEHLLTVVAKLLPPDHAWPEAIRQPSGDMIRTPLHVTPNGCGNSPVMWWLASQLYLQTMRLFPYWVRTWYNKQTKKNAELINSYTTKHFSPALITEEIEAVREYNDQAVKVRVRSHREVQASYMIDDSQLSMCLLLPANLPLAPVEMVQAEQSTLCSKMYDGWRKMLKSVLSYSNIPMLDSLKIWKQNIDQKFQGVEPCYICYCIVQITSGAKPTKQCRTCKNKFHSSCLYQWFSSSNKSTCPMCRAVW